MKKIKKIELRNKLIALYGAWNTWDRWVHLAYGLARNIEYSKMERCSNDAVCHASIARILYKCDMFEEYPAPTETNVYRSTPREICDFVKTKAHWVKKEPRAKVVQERTAAE